MSDLNVTTVAASSGCPRRSQGKTMAISLLPLTPLRDVLKGSHAVRSIRVLVQLTEFGKDGVPWLPMTAAEALELLARLDGSASVADLRRSSRSAAPSGEAP